MSVQQAVVDNPVTTVAGIGLIVTGVGVLLKWDDTTQQAIAQIALGLAVFVRAIIAMVKGTDS